MQKIILIFTILLINSSINVHAFTNDDISIEVESKIGTHNGFDEQPTIKEEQILEDSDSIYFEITVTNNSTSALPSQITSSFDHELFQNATIQEIYVDNSIFNNNTSTLTGDIKLDLSFLLSPSSTQKFALNVEMSDDLSFSSLCEIQELFEIKSKIDDVTFIESSKLIILTDICTLPTLSSEIKVTDGNLNNTVEPGETLNYEIKIINESTSRMQLTDIVVTDKLTDSQLSSSTPIKLKLYNQFNQEIPLTENINLKDGFIIPIIDYQSHVFLRYSVTASDTLNENPIINSTQVVNSLDQNNQQLLSTTIETNPTTDTTVPEQVEEIDKDSDSVEETSDEKDQNDTTSEEEEKANDLKNTGFIFTSENISFLTGLLMIGIYAKFELKKYF